MIVISASNFDDEMYSEKLVCQCDSEFWAERIARLLNSVESEDSPNYFKVKPDDYKLYKFEP